MGNVGKKILVILAICAWCVLFTPQAYASDHFISGDNRVGCVDKEYFEQLVGYAVDKDYKAFNHALAIGIAAGTCTYFQKGERVFILDSAVFSGLTKIRRGGETTGYWVNIEAVQ